MNDETNPAWIAAIFARLTVAYGERFKAMYGEQPSATIKADWAKRLLHVSGARIRYALDNLPPDHPPNAMQFRALCMSMRLEPIRALENRLATTPPGHILERLGDTIAALGGASPMGKDPRAWAYRLKAREEAGEKLTEFQKQAWRSSVRAPPAGSAFSPGMPESSNHAGSEPSEPETL